MIFQVQLTEQAEKDLRGIYEYIAFRLLSPINAEKQLSRIEAGILSLKDLPERCPRFPKEPWFGMGLRRMIVDHYVVLYLVDTEREQVMIVRVLYGSRNIEELLKEHLEEDPVN